MYPSIALFHPNLARTVLEYRMRTLEGARVNAKEQGYKVQYVVGVRWWSASLCVCVWCALHPAVTNFPLVWFCLTTSSVWGWV